MSKSNSTSVIVVGGSLVGLSTALFLASWKVPVILLERHPSSSLHPRAIGYTARTIEALRAVGVDSRLPPVNWTGGPPRRVVVESLTGKWQEEQHWTPQKPGEGKGPQGPGKGPGKGPGGPGNIFAPYSPVSAIAVAQDKIEPVLRQTAAERGADLRLGCKVTAWTQDDEGVTAVYMDKDGNEITVKGSYLIACDGCRSPIRESLGIKRKGVGEIRQLRSILFRCPSIEYILEQNISQFQIEGREDGFEGFLTTYRDGRWALMWQPAENKWEETTKATMDEATQKDWIRKAIGKDIPDDEIELITTGMWDLAGLIAESFSSGRIFLAGDAAHMLPPNRGGYGANTGIADAFNIAWKIASVMNGISRPELLDTYDAERRPVAQVRHDQIFARNDHRQFVQDREWEGKDVEILDDIAMELGQIYQSDGIISADETLPLAQRPDEWKGQPGTRAPHIKLLRNGEKISSLDLFCQDWVLLSKDDAWKTLTADASKATGIEATCVQVGKDVEEDEGANFEESYGLDSTGAVLVRPDGIIAWRAVSKPEGALEALADALKKTAYAVKGAE